MSAEMELQARSGAACELCAASDGLAVFGVAPKDDGLPEHSALLCATCRGQLEQPETTDVHHWRCLNTSMWSEVPAVQVLAWRMLTRLRDEAWAAELLEMLYLDDELTTWAAATGEGQAAAPEVKHVDSNGVRLESGDTVTLIKDLVVKGGGFTAKRGTAVRNISLVADNPAHIEGRVNGQLIVILTEFVKRAK